MVDLTALVDDLSIAGRISLGIMRCCHRWFTLVVYIGFHGTVSLDETFSLPVSRERESSTNI